MLKLVRLFFIFAITVIVIGRPASAGDGTNAVQAQFVNKANMLEVSYMLADKKKKYFMAILDELKAGKRIRIQHDVDVYTSGFYAKHIKNVERSYFVKYHLLSSQFQFDEADGNTYRTGDEDVLRAFVFTVNNLPVVKSSKLSTGDEYVVKFESSYKEDDRELPWYRKYGFNVLRRSVKDEVVYIAR